MAADRRINVASGRSLEKLAHYSRALRVGDTVLQSGTTAIDRAGTVRGVDDVAKQVETIMTIAEWSMGRAGGRLADVVRSRIYVTDIQVGDRAARTLARYLRDARPAATLVQVDRLARPEQLVEIELDAVDGAGASARRISSGRAIEDEYAYSRAVRVGDRVFVSGTTALSARGIVEGKGDLYRQTRHTMDTIFSTLLGIPALVWPDMLIEIEAEAIVGAAKTRRDIYTQQQREKPRGYARAVAVGDWIWVSGCTSMNAAGEPQAAGDWAAQSDLSVETARWALEQAGASLDDVVRRRTFTVDGAAMNRAHGEGPAWFAKSCPASLGCRIAGLARPELLVEVEVAAVKGAHAGIEWVGPDTVDPLERG